jgi:hypothetical protein
VDPTRKARRPERTIRNAILGRNAARAYRFNPDARRRKISCDQVNQLRDEGYVNNAGSERESAPLASNTVLGPRTAGEVLKSLTESPWSP